MLALLQVLHMRHRRPDLLKALFTLSNQGADFPLMTVSINMTQIALSALRGGALVKEAMRAKSMVEAFHAIHAACYYHMFYAWKERGLSISNFGFLKKEIEGLALKKPAMLLKNLRAWENRNLVVPSKAEGKVNFG